jgi:pimeloyl-ACP methyl ester carboxylesterase
MDHDGETVLLLHGLWMNRAAMLFLAASLAARGFRTRTVGYFSAVRGLEHNIARVRRAIASAAGSAIHLVAHSMGGIVGLRAIEDALKIPVRRVVLLGAPIGGCAGGRQFAQSRWGAPLLGTTKSLWLAMPEVILPAGPQIGAIAGTRRFGLGGLLLRLPHPNDGVVTVTETKHPALADHIVLPVAHSQMLISPVVARQVAAFLETGAFAR